MAPAGNSGSLWKGKQSHLPLKSEQYLLARKEDLRGPCLGHSNACRMQLCPGWGDQQLALAIILWRTGNMEQLSGAGKSPPMALRWLDGEAGHWPLQPPLPLASPLLFLEQFLRMGDRTLVFSSFGTCWPTWPWSTEVAWQGTAHTHFLTTCPCRGHQSPCLCMRKTTQGRHRNSYRRLVIELTLKTQHAFLRMWGATSWLREIYVSCYHGTCQQLSSGLPSLPIPFSGNAGATLSAPLQECPCHKSRALTYLPVGRQNHWQAESSAKVTQVGVLHVVHILRSRSCAGPHATW